MDPEQVAMEEILAPPPETISPEAKVFVAALFVWRILPPVITRPEAEERPPEVETEIPPAKVDVAVEEAFKAWSWRRPETFTPAAKVEEAEDKTLVRVESPLTAREEEAERAPVTLRFLVKVEEAMERSPPEESTEKRVVVAPDPWRSRWMSKGFPVWLVKVIKVRRSAVVVVAAMVVWELEATVVVPTAT